jgi:hypothetical protein
MMAQNNKHSTNAFEPAFWAFVSGASTVTAVHSLSDSTLAPDWLKILLVLTLSTVATGSAYEAYKTATNLNKQITNLKNKQK